MGHPVASQRQGVSAHVGSSGDGGINIQPWRVYVVTGHAKDRLCAAIQRVNEDSALDETCTDEWDYYPREWISPYLERRRTVGWKLYGLLGI